MENVEAVIFDLDDTLIETQAVDKKAFEQTLAVLLDVLKTSRTICFKQVFEFFKSVAKYLFEQSEHQSYCNTVGISSMEMMLFKDEWLEGGAFKEFVLAYQINVWSAVLEKIHTGTGDFPIDGISDLYQRNWFLNCVKKDNVIESLDSLYGNFKLAILSNGFNLLQRHKISTCGLEGYFDEILISSELNVGKPAPILFETLMKKMGVKASQTLMVGDNPIKDIEGALSVGCRAFLINPNFNDVNFLPYKIQNLRQLKYIQRMDAKCKM